MSNTPAPTADEQEVVKRAAVLVVAALTFPRFVDAAEAASDQPDLMRRRARAAFMAAEGFVDEAEARGFDVGTIMQLAAKAGL